MALPVHWRALCRLGLQLSHAGSMRQPRQLNPLVPLHVTQFQELSHQITASEPATEVLSTGVSQQPDSYCWLHATCRSCHYPTSVVQRQKRGIARSVVQGNVIYGLPSSRSGPTPGAQAAQYTMLRRCDTDRWPHAELLRVPVTHDNMCSHGQSSRAFSSGSSSGTTPNTRLGPTLHRSSNARGPQSQGSGVQQQPLKRLRDDADFEWDPKPEGAAPRQAQGRMQRAHPGLQRSFPRPSPATGANMDTDSLQFSCGNPCLGSKQRIHQNTSSALVCLQVHCSGARTHRRIHRFRLSMAGHITVAFPWMQKSD
jgi:hypothetical protein